MGWQGQTSTSQRIFGNTVDTAIRQASCDVVLIKVGEKLRSDALQSEFLTQNSALATLTSLNYLNRWLVPISGGPNAEYMLQLLPALTALSRDLEIYLCQVFDPTQSPPDLSSLDNAAAFLRQNSGIYPIVTPLFSAEIDQAAIDFATDKGCQAIILGASREGLLQQTIHGNLPESIARGSDCTVIVVRKAI